MLARFPLLQFLALRTGLLVVVAVALSLAGLRGVPAILLALVISSIISVFALSSHRDAVSGSIDGRLSRMRRRMNEAASSEDE